MPRSVFSLFVIAAFTGLLAVSCGGEEPDPELENGECTSDEDCMGSFVCVSGNCQAPDGADAGMDAGEDAGVDAGPDVVDDADGEDADPTDPNDTEPECTPGQTRCASDTTVERCIAPSGDDPYWTAGNCEEGQVCEDGLCRTEDDPDDCCPDGCDDEEICHQCSCTEYDPAECTFQDQPCSEEGQISNDLTCIDFGESGELRCVGLCNPGADDPDTTCPEDNSICLFEDTSQPNGICMKNCSIGDGCADDWMTCRYNDQAADDGFCQPQTDTIAIGDPCPPDEPYSCAGDGFCVGGFCRQTCRPFHDDESTDCADGYCLAFNGNSGVCGQDSSIGDGQCTAHFTTCGEDATGCFAEPLGDPQPEEFVCYDICRLQLDDYDCADDYTCEQYDPNNPAVGRCEAE